MMINTICNYQCRTKQYMGEEVSDFLLFCTKYLVRALHKCIKRKIMLIVANNIYRVISMY